MSHIALVTGAASGIGKAVATALAAKGMEVTLLVRNRARGEAAMAAIRAEVPSAKLALLECDLASQRSIRDAAARFLGAHHRLDVLVNSAGVFVPKRVITEDGVESTFAVNVLGYFLLTTLLLPALRKAAPSRIVNVASKYGGAKIPFDDLAFADRKYSFMKSTPPTMLGRVLLTQEFAHRLAGSGVVVNAVHPGLVKDTRLLNDVGGFFRWMTNLVGAPAEQGADTVVWLATAPEAEKQTGRLWHKRKPIKTPGQGSDAAVRARFWDECERLVGGVHGSTHEPAVAAASRPNDRAGPGPRAKTPGSPPTLL